LNNCKQIVLMENTSNLITKLKKLEFPLNYNEINDDYFEILLGPSDERYLLIEWLLNKYKIIY